MSVRLFPGFTSSALPPGGTAGQSLFKNSSTNYDVSWKQGAAVNFSGTYNAVTSTTAVMFGSGLTITTLTTGRVLASFQMTAQNTTTTGYAQASLRFGTGTPPAQGAPVTGTFWGTFTTATPPATSAYVQLVLNTFIPLLIGTTYWVDMAVLVASGSVNFQNALLTLIEF